MDAPVKLFFCFLFLFPPLRNLVGPKQLASPCVYKESFDGGILEFFVFLLSCKTSKRKPIPREQLLFCKSPMSFEIFLERRPKGWNFRAALCSCMAHGSWLLPFPPKGLEFPSGLMFVRGSWFMALATPAQWVGIPSGLVFVHGSWFMALAIPAQRVGISERSYVRAWLMVHGSCHSRPKGWTFRAVVCSCMAHGSWLLPFPPRGLEFPSGLLFLHGSWFMALAISAQRVGISVRSSVRAWLMVHGPCHSRPKGWNLERSSVRAWLMDHGSAQRVGFSKRPYVRAWLMVRGFYLSRPKGWNFRAVLCSCMAHGSWLSPSQPEELKFPCGPMFVHGSWFMALAIPAPRVGISARPYARAWLMVQGSRHSRPKGWNFRAVLFVAQGSWFMALAIPAQRVGMPVEEP